METSSELTVGSSLVDANGEKKVESNGNGHHSEDQDIKLRVLEALLALQRGDFSVRLPYHWDGVDARLADAFNSVMELNQRMAEELDRMSRVVGRDGNLEERASIGYVSGSWLSSIQSLNLLVTDLSHPIRETGRIIGAFAQGRSIANDGRRSGGPAAAGRILKNIQDR